MIPPGRMSVAQRGAIKAAREVVLGQDLSTQANANYEKTTEGKQETTRTNEMSASLLKTPVESSGTPLV